MQYMDSHCHLHDSRIVKGIRSIMVRAKKAGVQYMVSCATMEKNFELTAQLAKQDPAVLPCFGIHPWFVDTVSRHWKQTLETYLTKVPSGIGETGIDFTDRTVNRDRQLEVFKYHLALSREMNLPINIHVRKAWDTFIHVLKSFGKLKTPGIIHSYSGSADMIPMFEKFGLYISFSGSVTTPGAKKVILALKKVSPRRFVLETDTPDIYPYIEPADSSRLNEPANLPAIAQVASIRAGLDREAFCNHAFENSKTVFSPLLKKRKCQ